MSLCKRMLEDLDEEIPDHVERETQDNIDRGMDPEEAHYAALRKFGNVARVNPPMETSHERLRNRPRDAHHSERSTTTRKGHRVVQAGRREAC